MIWLTLISLAAAIAVSFLDVPLWARFLGIAVAAGFVLMGLMKELPKPKGLKIKPRYVQVATVILALVVANVAARYFEKVWDFSRSRIYSLRQESVDWISKLKEPVTIHIFLRSDDKTGQYVAWLKESASRLGDHLKIVTHNINRDIALAEKYSVKRVGETVLESGAHWIKVDDFKEETLVKGLVRLFGRAGTTICFTSGHGEADIVDESPAGLSFAAGLLRDLGYGVRTINLATISDLETCSAVIGVGIRSELFPNELTQLEKIYGKVPLFLALDKQVSSNLAGFLEAKGLTLGKTWILDNDNVAQKIPLTDISIDLSGGDPMTVGLQGILFFPQVQSLSPSSPQWVPIVSTSPQKNCVEEGGAKGPFVVVAVHVQDKGKVIPLSGVFGSSRAFLNANWGYGNNAAFFARVLRFLLNESSVELPDHEIVSEPLMNLTDSQVAWIKNVAFYIVPGLALFICLGVWTIHRRSSS